jgi:hypothetical protein
VGFKPAEIRSRADLIHNRNISSARPLSERAARLRETLEQMVSAIPMADYPKLDPPSKLAILNRLIAAHDFAWNEVTLQTREVSEESALIYSRLKTFYSSLFEQYPSLLKSFHEEITNLKAIISQKDQHIANLDTQIKMRDLRLDASANLITGLKKRVEHLQERKARFKVQLNEQVLASEQLTATITDLRCQFAKYQDQISAAKLAAQEEQPEPPPPPAPAPPPPPPTVELVDISVDTSDLVALRMPVSGSKSLMSIHRVTPREDHTPEAVQLPPEVEVEPPPPEHSTLRALCYRFMQIEVPPPNFVLSMDTKSEFKKFFWVYPKVLSLFIQGLKFEDPARPWQSFESVVIGYMSSLYQTNFLTQQMINSLIQSSQILEVADPALQFFNLFLRNEYDMAQFRLFSTLLEYSLGEATPSAADLMKDESLIPADAHLTIPRDSACEIYQTLYPFDPLPLDLSQGDPSMEFWELMHICLRRFDSCRNHIRSVIKAAFCLSDCADINHITRSHFASFIGVTFPDLTPTDTKDLWHELSIRNTADGKQLGMLDYSAICALVTEREALFFGVMKVHLIKNFTALFFDFNALVLKGISFIVSRLVYSIPVIQEKLPGGNSVLMSSAVAIRECLFLCDIAGAFFQYRMMLHLIDEVFVKDSASIKLSNASTGPEIQILIHHILDREKAVGLIEIKK